MLFIRDAINFRKFSSDGLLRFGASAMNIRMVSTIPPPTFAASANLLIHDTGAMRNVAFDMPELSSIDSIPDKLDTIINTHGSLHRHTISLIPKAYRGQMESSSFAEPEHGFDAERTYLQAIVDKHANAERPAALPIKFGSQAHSTTFLCRLVSMTGKTLQDILGCRTDEELEEWLDDLGRLSGINCFAALDGLAKRQLGDDSVTLDRTHGAYLSAERLFEGALLYDAMSDPYAQRTVAEKLSEASELYEQSSLVDTAAMASDLAVRAYDRSFEDEGGRPTANPYTERTAKLLYESLDRRFDMLTFGVRYIYGLHHAQRSDDPLTMQNLFGASVLYYREKGITRETARAYIRKLWAFVQRNNLSAEDWELISGDLKTAADILSDSWTTGDSKIATKLKELADQAISFGGLNA